MPQARIDLGYYNEFSQLDYYKEAIEESDIKKAEELCFDSDVVIYGSAPFTLIERRIKSKKLTFSYNERWFKQGFLKHPGDVYRAFKKFTLPRNKNFYSEVQV